MNLTDKASRWDERYSQEDYAFGKEPNEFLQQQLPELQPIGKILFPADGEGRNGVFAAKLGWEVSCFDISIEGKKKAEKLSKEQGVQLDYQIGDINIVDYQESQFDAIGIIYAHFGKEDKAYYYSKFNSFLKKGGYVILEVFSKKHIDYVGRDERVGGPRDLDTLVSIEEIKTYFPDYQIIVLEEKEITLKEGLYHIGKGSVIRFVGRKK